MAVIRPVSMRLANPMTSKGPPLAAARSSEPLPLNLRTYKVAIYETLTRMIGELDLPPGSRLVETELATWFNVSKTPVREALLLLEADGVVKLEPYQGATVSWLSVEEYEELVFIQDALEQPALPRVAERISRREIDAIGRLVERMKLRRRDNDSLGFFEAGAVMHQRLFAAADLPRLMHVVMSLILHPTRRYERVFMHQFDDLWDIEMGIITGRFENIAAGDPVAAATRVREGREAMLRHIRERLDDPRIAAYLAPAVETRPRRSSRGRGPVPNGRWSGRASIGDSD
jgi:DNA-binding GntR family transcriptional regulator